MFYLPQNTQFSSSLKRSGVSRPVLRRSFSRANLVVEVSMTFSADPYDINDMEDFPAIFPKKINIARMDVRKDTFFLACVHRSGTTINLSLVRTMPACQNQT